MKNCEFTANVNTVGEVAIYLITGKAFIKPVEFKKDELFKTFSSNDIIKKVVETDNEIVIYLTKDFNK